MSVNARDMLSLGMIVLLAMLVGGVYSVGSTNS